MALAISLVTAAAIALVWFRSWQTAKQLDAFGKFYAAKFGAADRKLDANAALIVGQARLIAEVQRDVQTRARSRAKRFRTTKAAANDGQAA